MERTCGRHRLARTTSAVPPRRAWRPHPAVASGRPRPQKRSQTRPAPVVVGAGFLGTEVASTANALGVAVTLVDPSPPLSRVLGDEIAQLLAKRYRDHGIDLRVGVTLDRIDVAEGKVRGVRLNDGTSVASDAVLIAVGAEPNVPRGLASSPAGGILTDAGGRTAFDDVYACGDVARSHHPLLG